MVEKEDKVDKMITENVGEVAVVENGYVVIYYRDGSTKTIKLGIRK